MIAFREIGASEIDLVMPLMARAFDPAFGEGWNRAQCLGILDQANVWLSVAEDAGPAPIGFALNRATLDEAELLLLAVDPLRRGEGIATRLVARSAMLARRRGATRLMLEVRETNGALALYRREGFAEIGRRRGYYRGAGGIIHDALTLARALPSDGHSHYLEPMNMPDVTP